MSKGKNGRQESWDLLQSRILVVKENKELAKGNIRVEERVVVVIVLIGESETWKNANGMALVENMLQIWEKEDK